MLHLFVQLMSNTAQNRVAFLEVRYIEFNKLSELKIIAQQRANPQS